MTVGAAPTSVFDADLPTLAYGEKETPAEVYPRLQAAQRQASVALGPFGPEVLSYHLVRSVLRDARFQIPPGINLLVQGVTSGPLWDKVVNSLLCLEGDAHHRLRSLTSKAFTPRATLRLHDTMVDVMNELVDRVADAGRCDVVTDLARPYPVPIICALLGAPREDWQQFSLWADDVFKAFSFSVDLREVEPVVMRAWRQLDDYVDDMVTGRRHSLTDDLLSDLIRAEDDGDRLNTAELRMLAGGLLLGGDGHHPEPGGRLGARPLRAPGAVGAAQGAPRTGDARGRGDHAPLADRVRNPSPGSRGRRAGRLPLPRRHDGPGEYRCGQP